MLRLLALDDRLADFGTFHMQGHWDADGTEMVSAIQRAAGRARVATRRFPWWMLPVLAPVSALFREMREMRYLWQQPIRMDNARLREAIGDEPHTPWDVAVKTTPLSMRCL
jgi:nucleoside-diphosphate-sugar epimerase